MRSDSHKARALERFRTAHAAFLDAFADLISDSSATDGSLDDQYLTLDQLVKRVQLGKSTIRAYMHSGELQEGREYFRPRGNRVLFKWSAMKAWVEHRGSTSAGPEIVPFRRGSNVSS